MTVDRAGIGARQRLPCQEGPLGVGEADAPPSEPVLQQAVLGLKDCDDDQLMAMNPTCGDHQQK